MISTLKVNKTNIKYIKIKKNLAKKNFYDTMNYGGNIQIPHETKCLSRPSGS